MSHPWATICIQVPMLEVQAPIHIKRKSRYWNALKIRPRTAAGLLRTGFSGGVAGSISFVSTNQVVSHRDGSSILGSPFLPQDLREGWEKGVLCGRQLEILPRRSGVEECARQVRSERRARGEI